MFYAEDRSHKENTWYNIYSRLRKSIVTLAEFRVYDFFKEIKNALCHKIIYIHIYYSYRLRIDTIIINIWRIKISG